MTLTISDETYARLRYALGKAHNLMDTQDPPQRRDATGAELKQYGINHYKQLLTDIEGPELAAANPPPQPAPGDIT